MDIFIDAAPFGYESYGEEFVTSSEWQSQGVAVRYVATAFSWGKQAGGRMHPEKDRGRFDGFRVAVEIRVLVATDASADPALRTA
jgi:hypothetical protein